MGYIKRRKRKKKSKLLQPKSKLLPKEWKIVATMITGGEVA